MKLVDIARRWKLRAGKAYQKALAGLRAWRPSSVRPAAMSEVDQYERDPRDSGQLTSVLPICSWLAHAMASRKQPNTYDRTLTMLRNTEHNTRNNNKE
jgi:hypothetical protein